MIDRESRSVAAHLLNDLLAGSISVWHLEDAWPRSKTDLALLCILRWLWTLYPDDEEMGACFNLFAENRIIVDRCRLFLRSNLEFERKTLSLLGKFKEKLIWGVEWPSTCTMPDSDYWPFPSAQILKLELDRFEAVDGQLTV